MTASASDLLKGEPGEARERFLALVRSAVRADELLKLTLGRYRGADASLRNLFIRPVTLKAGPRLGFVWRHATKDIAKNHPPAEALKEIECLIGSDFLDAHLFTRAHTAQLECNPDGRPASLRIMGPSATSPTPTTHDRAKSRPIAADAGWLQALGVTNPRGLPREGMAPKFRQIEKFAELLASLMAEAGLEEPMPVSVADMGSGKGYLTFAISALLGDRGHVLGIEVRPELVELCNRVARDEGFASRLTFSTGTIVESPLEHIDVLIALHACDTATDDALAKGIAAGAKLLVVAPCCQKELRPRLAAPPVLAAAFRHGIFQERQAEFVTDALRAQLLEWAGYRTKVIEFVSTEHTAKNLMIAAIKTRDRDESLAGRIREFAAFYGIKRQALATHLNFALSG